ncbi:hypothetical protein VF21_01680, partial [Pseudogymnoascus sp. 05NY08]
MHIPTLLLALSAATTAVLASPVDTSPTNSLSPRANALLAERAGAGCAWNNCQECENYCFR